MRNNGFTAIESLIVVFVLSLLAGLLSPVYFESRASAKVTRAKSELQAIASAARSKSADNYTMKGMTLSSLTSSGYLSEIHPDPWGRNYVLVNTYLDEESSGAGDGKPDIGTIVFTYSLGPDGVSQTNHSTAVTTGDDIVLKILTVN